MASLNRENMFPPLKKVGKAVAFSSVSSILGSLWDERHEEGDDE